MAGSGNILRVDDLFWSFSRSDFGQRRIALFFSCSSAHTGHDISSMGPYGFLLLLVLRETHLRSVGGSGAEYESEYIPEPSDQELTFFLLYAIYPPTAVPRGGDDVDSVSVLRNGRRHLRRGDYASSRPGRDGWDPGALRPPRLRQGDTFLGNGTQAPAPSDKRRAAAQAGRGWPPVGGLSGPSRHSGATGASRHFPNWIA